MQQPTASRATMKIAVRASSSQLYDQGTGPALAVIAIEETFIGDIEAQSTVRALEVRRGDHSASLVSLQRVHGELRGQKGSFVLQGEETVEDGRIEATWSVVPGSGTGELAGLRGEGGFKGTFGTGSEGILDYWFER